MPKDLSSIFPQYQKKPEPKKPDPPKPEEPKTEEKKTVVVISGTPTETKTETVPKSSIFPPKNPPVQTPPPQPTIQPQPTQPPANPLGQPKTTPATSSTDEFDYSPETPENKHTVLIYGQKGASKTTLSFSFPGTMDCVSFDKKSTVIKMNMTEADQKRITVYDGLRYLDKTSGESWLISANQSWKYLSTLFQKIPERPDWVVVDGGEVFETIAEMVMRHKNNLQPYQGVQNLNVWKERRRIVDQFYRICYDFAKKGVIWTSYVHVDSLYKDGQVVESKEIPKWLDTLRQETDSVIKVERTTDKTRQTFYATVETSKWKELPCSPKTDITNDGIKKLAKGEL